MSRYVLAAALASILSGCVMPDRDTTYSQSEITGTVKPPKTVQTPTRTATSENPKPDQIVKPAVVLGAAF